MAKAKKKTAVKKQSVAKEATRQGKEFTFISRDKSKEVKMNSPMEGNKASEVLFDVLNSGNMPNGLKLQWADSYMGHFINRRGKNACGANKVKGLLVINGIADELEAAGVKGIIQPEKKPYKAIRLTKMDSSDIKDLTKKIAMVLGFTGTKKTASAKKATVEA